MQLKRNKLEREKITEVQQQQYLPMIIGNRMGICIAQQIKDKEEDEV